MKLRDYQVDSVQQGLNAYDERQWLCITAPTGAGKTAVMLELALSAVSSGLRVALFTDRKLLLAQLFRQLTGYGIETAVRAADWDDERNPHCLFQLCSIATEMARERSGRWSFPKADLILIDEADRMKAQGATRVLMHYKKKGIPGIGFTATPMDIWHIYDRLYVAVTNSELTERGIHLPLITYRPATLDMALVKRMSTGEYVWKQGAFREVVKQQLSAKIMPMVEEVNPEKMPMMAFGPDVPSSKWVAEDFRRHGYVTAHIDHKGIYHVGGRSPRNRQNDHVTIRALRDGVIQMLTNFGVLREGIDVPSLKVILLLAPIGRLRTYLQMGGRLLRNPNLEGYDNKVVLDFGGNALRHGFLDEDRAWGVGDTEVSVRKKREKPPEGEKQEKTIVCPNCFAERSEGIACHVCGHTHKDSHVEIIQLDGKLVKAEKEAKRLSKTEAQEIWERMFYQFKNSKRNLTFRQLREAYRQKTQITVNSGPFVPTSEEDWDKPLNQVAKKAGSLTPRNGYFLDMLLKLEYKGRTADDNTKQSLRKQGIEEPLVKKMRQAEAELVLQYLKLRRQQGLCSYREGTELLRYSIDPTDMGREEYKKHAKRAG